MPRYLEETGAVCDGSRGSLNPLVAERTMHLWCRAKTDFIDQHIWLELLYTRSNNHEVQTYKLDTWGASKDVAYVLKI